ncbi:T9SS type A sorting domain-containing protein, partial [Maribellus maritimus]|uniref:T9SS type A sorting domain-containing protein n=1 Tax=Maribellus maritimus TaxID=2870838 RepID=UPI001EEBE428
PTVSTGGEITGFSSGQPYTVSATSTGGCTSEISAQFTVEGPPDAPSAPNLNLTQPTCDVPTGTIMISSPTGAGFTYSINGTDFQSSATFSGVVPGTYDVIVKNADECVSTATQAVIEEQLVPNAPTINVSNECGQTVLTASNYTGSLAWSTGETTESIMVTEAGDYSVTQTVGDCTSDPANATAAPKAIPIISVVENDPLFCLLPGSLDFTFINVPNGISYTINYDAGSFSPVLVLNNEASVVTSAGTYNNLRITIDGCTSANGVNATLNDPNAPNAPEIDITDECGESLLTAINYEEGATLEWSTGETTESITVNESKTYSLTQELNGCISDAATAMAVPKTIPAKPDFLVTNNCDGTSILEAIDFDESADLKWSTNETTNIITVNEAKNYSLIQLIDGCASDTAFHSAAPKTAPTITAFENNPEECGSFGSIDFLFTDVPDGIYTISYDEGIFENVEISDDTASVETSAGSYSNLTITVDDCISALGISAILSEPNAPETPGVVIDDRCGESLLTVTTFNPNASLLWSTGDTTQTITVENAGTYSVVQTLAGCTSDARSVTALPKPIPETPNFTITDNCDGTSTLSVTDFANNTTLLWSTGETSELISVTEPGNYSLTQVLDGCESNSVTKTAAPKTAPTIVAEAISPENCGGKGSIAFTFTGVPDGIYNILYDNGSFPDVTISGNKTTVETTVGTYNNLKISINECISAEGINVTLSEPNAPNPPTITVENDCNNSILTVSNYDESATLLWSTGNTTPVLTVSSPGTYSVTQKLNGCTSDAASAVAEPKITKGEPEIEVYDNCGESIIKMNNLPSETWFTWQYNNVADSTREDSIIVNEPGEYTIYQQVGQCIGETTTVSANPMEIPIPPISHGDVLVCMEENTEVTAEASVVDENTILVWYDAETGGQIVQSPVLNSFGSVTYYAESENINTGCKSLNRTPVTLTVLQSAESFILDSAIIGKPENNVAVLIFPENVARYQWYLNNTQIDGATGQYYYVPDSERKNENIFSVEVEISNGCKAKYSYSYADILSSAILTGTNDFKHINAPAFTIYPNPANEKLHISLDVSMIINEPKIKGKIFSGNGICVSEFIVNNPIETINTQKLSPGIYSVVLYGEQGNFYTKKLIVSH